jgi:hypothetical protein
MFVRYLLNRFLVYIVKSIEKTIHRIFMGLYSLISVQVIDRLQFACRVREASNDQMTKQWFLYDVETDAVKDGAEDEFRTDCPHGCIFERIEKILDDKIFEERLENKGDESVGF